MKLFSKKLWLFYPLLIVYIIEFIALWINPIGWRMNWFSENLPMVLIVGALFFTYKKFKFSNISYILMFILIYLHTIGWHYTFANVPFDFVTNMFWFERNHFDRIAHFSVWFYAYPFIEILTRIYNINYKFVLILFPLFFIISIAWVYEIIEWIYADIAWWEAWIAFLGSQWDIWDAQKDMLADTLGAIFAIILYFLLNKKTSIFSRFLR